MTCYQGSSGPKCITVSTKQLPGPLPTTYTFAGVLLQHGTPKGGGPMSLPRSGSRVISEYCGAAALTVRCHVDLSCRCCRVADVQGIASMPRSSGATRRRCARRWCLDRRCLTSSTLLLPATTVRERVRTGCTAPTSITTSSLPLHQSFIMGWTLVFVDHQNVVVAPFRVTAVGVTRV